MYDIVFVRFECNELEDCEGVYVDGKQLGRLDSTYRNYEDVLSFLEKEGVLQYKMRYIEGEAAKRFVGLERYQNYEEYDRVEREVKLEKAAALRAEAEKLQAEAEALEAPEEDE